MNIQDSLAKIKLVEELKLAKELKRILLALHARWTKIKLAYGPRLSQALRQSLVRARELRAHLEQAFAPALTRAFRLLPPSIWKSWARIKRTLAPELVKVYQRFWGRVREQAVKIKIGLPHRLRLTTPASKSLMVGGGGCAAICMVLWAVWPEARDPYPAFDEARIALHEARQAEAKIYAPKLLQLAESRWQRAHLSWHFENQRWRIRRDYQGVIDSVRIATKMARQASTLAVAKRDSLHWLSATGITLVKDKIDSFKAQFHHLPVQTALRKRFLAGELAILESELAFNRRDYFRALVKYRQAAADVGSAGEQAGRTMQAYLANLPKWRNWVAETIAWSKQEQDLVIVVDKMAANVQIYHSGNLLAEYPVELGPRWVGHKRHRGDGATPEGRYHVIRKKDFERTIYHRALEIDYPNEADKEAFQAAIARGELPRGTHIGGLIEIHGEGGKGANWTAGCVALRNPDMETMFNLAKVGTPVTIVGSLKGLAAPPARTNNMVNSTNGTTHRKKS